jgi:hypothetical protein
LHGNLAIMVRHDLPHIQELLTVLRTEIALWKDASIRRIMHLFGPGNHGRADVYEIRIGDDGVLPESLSMGGGNYRWWLPVAEYEPLFEQAQRRMPEIESFWDAINNVVEIFCYNQDFGEEGDFPLEERVRELTLVRQEDLEALEAETTPKVSTQQWKCSTCQTQGVVEHPTDTRSFELDRLVSAAHKQISPECKQGYHLSLPRS